MWNQVAAMSGDARRALEICRRAAELTDFRLKQSQKSSGLTAASSKAMWYKGHEE